MFANKMFAQLRTGFRLVSSGIAVRIRFGSPFSSKVVVCGHCLVGLSLTIYGTLKWLSSLPVLMQKYFRGDSVALGISLLNRTELN